MRSQPLSRSLAASPDGGANDAESLRELSNPDEAFERLTNAGSDDLDGDVVGVTGKGRDVGGVSGQDGASGFGDRDDEGVDG